MAEAAEKQLDLIWWQNFITGSEAGALVVTIILTIVVIRQQERHARQELRAYVSATPFHIFSFDDKNRAVAKFKMRNVGQTPAFDVFHESGVQIVNSAIPDDFDFPLGGPQGVPFTLFPGEAMDGSRTTERVFTADEIAKIRTGEAKIIIYGTVHYRDAFGERWQTDFSRTVEATTEILRKLSSKYGLEDLKITYEVTERHNGAT